MIRDLSGVFLYYPVEESYFLVFFSGFCKGVFCFFLGCVWFRGRSVWRYSINIMDDAHGSWFHSMLYLVVQKNLHICDFDLGIDQMVHISSIVY